MGISTLARRFLAVARGVLAAVHGTPHAGVTRAGEACPAAEVDSHYRTLLESVDEGVCLLDVIFDAEGARAVDYRFVAMNKAFARHAGLHEVTGRTVREVVPDLDPAWFEIYGRVARTGEPARLERFEPAMDRWFAVEATRVGPPDAHRVAVLFRDVTERRRAEDALRASERRAREAAAQAEAERAILDAILEAAPAGIIVADATGRLVRFNPANELLWGEAPFSGSVEEYGEWKGWWADESERRGRRLAPDEWAMSRALRGDTVRDDIVEIEPFGQPGVRRTIMNSGAPVRDAEVRVTGAVVVQMDISALVAARAARHQSEQLLRATLDNFPTVIAFKDRDGRFIDVNRVVERTLGVPKEAIIGRTMADFVPGDAAEVLHQHDREVMASGLPRQFEETTPLPGGTVHHLNTNFPLIADTGEVYGTGHISHDITRQKEAEAALLALNERLRDADRRKDEFIGVLAHELRNPLAPVRLAVEILRRTAPAEPRIERVRDVIDRQVTHMSRLIDDLLDVSRIARGKLALRNERCDIGHIVRQTVEDYRPSLEGAGLALVVATPVEPIWVEGDPVRLAQMIGNLLHNAGRFTDHGGRVEVRADLDRASRCAIVGVSDTGVGIEPDLLARLFDPFSQAHQDLARSKGGLGLGLALTKGLAELHGGGIDVVSRGGGAGATFTLRLPLSPAQHADARPTTPLVVRGDRLRILVVEDNHDAAETLGDLLVLAGHEVKLTYDGTSGVAAARGFHPHVVISDIGLPGTVDGYAVARTLRADPQQAGVHLIAISGYANEDARRRSRDAGFDAHLAKPPDIATLERALAAVRRT